MQVITQNCTLYTYSEKALQQCMLFQNYTASYLQRTAYGGQYSSIGHSQVYVLDKWAFKDNVTDLASKRTGLEAICHTMPAAIPTS